MIEQRGPDKILEKEKIYLDKYFPESDIENISNSYYWYWKDKFNKAEEVKKNCQHIIRHCRCGICNKILSDATKEEDKQKTIIIKK
jgi:hypothetical protein